MLCEAEERRALTGVRISSGSPSISHILGVKAGKAIVLKSVASAIPNYVMNYFKPPLGVVGQVNKAMAKFWWANEERKGDSLEIDHINKRGGRYGIQRFGMYEPRIVS
ncbi:hypothetical protein LIER_31508 [Lithospermum erythrorhizon]|uniref:Uncharacterized protein n=1 Tax=Lithospermum erythrorhizon TaxID=34254 RepID=A0AAV3RUR9_LITER